MENTISYAIITLKNSLKYNNAVVLNYKIEYPVLQSSIYQLALYKINRFYEIRAHSYQAYVEKQMYQTAAEQYEAATAEGLAAPPLEAVVKCSVTYRECCIISLYSDQYEYFGGAHGNTKRISETWNLQGVRQIKLQELLHNKQGWRASLLRCIQTQAARDPALYFQNNKRLLIKMFDEDHFYCAPDGVVIYYQQYDIAPYSGGIRKFLIPYSDEIGEPEKTCFSLRRRAPAQPNGS